MLAIIIMLTGQSLVETGEVYKRLAEEKYTLEDGIKQNFIEPFNQLQSKDLKEVNVSFGTCRMQTIAALLNAISYYSSNAAD